MFLNIAAYKFINLDADALPTLCKTLKETGLSLSLKGTILLGTEGINLFLAGNQEDIQQFKDYLASYSFFNDLFYKASYSSFIPFKKLCVKVRPEIVTFKQAGINPETMTAPYMSPQQLKQLLDSNAAITLLDTRNAFEYEIGAFSNAMHLEIDHFRDFPDALKKRQLKKNQPVVTYCTGGIRCEKAAAYLMEQGFEEVYQLEGGIIHYFEQCGGEHYRGDCFVFDDRIAVNSALEPVDT